MGIATANMTDTANSAAYATPLAELDPARSDRFQNDTWGPVFARLRREDPVLT